MAQVGFNHLVANIAILRSSRQRGTIRYTWRIRSLYHLEQINV